MPSSSFQVLIPLPDHDFDTTESAVAWQTFVNAGFQVTFATETGRVPACDPKLLDSGFFNPLPAGLEAVSAYRTMTTSTEFNAPITYRDIDINDFDAIHLSGGHAPGMKQYLDSAVLQQRVLDFAKADKLIGAVCHGTLIPARTVDPATGHSIIRGRRVTTLPLPLEKWAFRTTWFRVGRRYRTYWKYTETEIRDAVGPDGTVPRGETKFRWAGLAVADDAPFVVEDGNFVSARYPLDVPVYATTFVRKLHEQKQDSAPTTA
ncbi:DJ-1/PfpI family protein [Pseudonocardia sp. KRD-182]|uniref:type 1 glutamine amidotransferase domain-containing protein n=1 Tax=Pseudonocardia oceani TaxID=2792013 RepID=UPI001C4A5F1E|nr:type 1 glutamine amidotransferase domain-containing protein [Pseudonocardia oceani]MBW0107466.1 DJ-1/PfpI family protein [Pseudonocardia oceani]